MEEERGGASRTFRFCVNVFDVHFSVLSTQQPLPTVYGTILPVRTSCLENHKERGRTYKYFMLRISPRPHELISPPTEKHAFRTLKLGHTTIILLMVLLYNSKSNLLYCVRIYPYLSLYHNPSGPGTPDMPGLFSDQEQLVVLS